MMSRNNSSVRTATGCGLGDRGSGIPLPPGAGKFSFR